MKLSRRRPDASAPGVVAFILRLLRDRRANVTPMVALMLVPLLGALGVAGEVSSWYQTNRSMQNAADSAAIAAGTNGDHTNQDTGGDYMYQREAYAVASNYGFVNGANNVTVAASTTSASPCPSGQTCFQVTITKKVPLLLVGIVGYRDTGVTLNGSPAQLITSTAVATSGSGSTSFCLLALGGTVNSGITVNGGPKTDLSGCSVGSNGDETCNGHNLGADAGYAVYADSGCGLVQHSNVSPAFSDALDAARASNIPANTCSSYPQEPTGKKGTPLPNTNLLNGTKTVAGLTLGGTMEFCGDVQMSADTTLPAGTVLVIENGQLDTNGKTLNATSGATLVFTGPTVGGLSPSHFPTGGGTLNLTAPTSGAWSGVAIYQDPSLPSGSGVDMSAAGNSPTWNVVGIVYLPKSNVTISGAVNKNSNGACIGLIVNTITVNGTGYILDHNGCSADGVTLPGIAGVRVTLIQ